MNPTTITWGVLTVLYVAFFGWYTSFAGPLTDDEVEHYMALMHEHDPTADPEHVALRRAFLENDTGDDFVMLNVIDMHPTPLPIEGVEPGMTSDEVLAKYMEYMTGALFRRACHPVLYGQAAAQALEMFGVEGMREWSVGAGMRYRSRRDMLEIATNPAFQGSHEYKIAAIRKTIAFPIDPWIQLGDPRLVLALVFAVIGLSLSWLRASRA
jgi:hypothetical protein